MFIPLHDANSLKHIKLQFVTIAIIAINVIVWLVMSAGGEQAQMATALGYGYVPSVINDINELTPELVKLPEELTYITYAFLHADILHLGGNMLFLWVFGDNVEDALGHFKYLLFYLLSAAAGAWFHGFVVPASDSPLIGASGAVAGIVAAYLILHPRVKVWVLAFGRIPLRIPAFIPLLLWVGLQFVMFAGDRENQVSWAAHIGGMAAGAILVIILRRRGVPLFDSNIETPRAVETGAAEPVRQTGNAPRADTQSGPPVARTEPKPTRRWGRN